MKRKIFLLSLLLMLVAAIAWAADATYQAKVYMKQGAEEQVVADGGAITVESGGKITFGGVDLTSGTDVITTNAGTQTLTNKTLTAPTINGGTVASATVTSPDLTLGAIATQHDYTAHEDWTLSTTEATYLLLVTSSGDGTNSNIVVYPTPSNGKLYVVRNGSVQNNIIKPSGGTGITIASGKTASVIFWGTDFIRVTADATH